VINTLGIVPAAGKATRWGGMLKEVLPLSEHESLISRVVRTMSIGGANTCLVITTPEKIRSHSEALKRHDVIYRFQSEDIDLWGAIKESFTFMAKWNLFAMPDTFFPTSVFDAEMFKRDFNLCAFDTNKPNRFGVVEGNQINDKPDIIGWYPAWGVLTWSRSIIDFWVENINMIQNHTQAFNMAMQEFGFHLTKMPFYYDMATFTDYEEFIRAAIH